MFKIVSNFRELVDGSFLRFCLKYLKSGDNVVEVGPGDAKFANALIKNIRDLNYSFVDVEDRRVYKRECILKIIDISSQEMDYPDASLDAIIASQVIEHLKNASNFFIQAHRVLKPGGLLLLKMPNFGNIFNKLKFLKDSMPFRLNGTLDDGGHINFYTHRHLVYFLKDYFKLLEVSGDVFVDMFLSRVIFKLLKRDIYLVSGYIRSTAFSWNVILSLEKKDKKNESIVYAS